MAQNVVRGSDAKITQELTVVTATVQAHIWLMETVKVCDLRQNSPSFINIFRCFCYVGRHKHERAKRSLFRFFMTTVSGRIDEMDTPECTTFRYDTVEVENSP